MSYKGIDVSKWQGNIDWTKVKESGIQFAMLRSSFGTNGKDSYFEKNYKNAKAVGMPLGAYHYSYAKTVAEAIKEAEFCISVLKGKTFDYPIAYDLEEKSVAALGKGTVSAIADAFCSRLEKEGYYVVIYSSLHWFNTYFTETIFKKYDIWLAQWASKITFGRPVGLWQYTSKGSVPGISGNVDMNRSFKDYPSIIANLRGPVNNDDDISSKSVETLAQEVLANKYGVGEARKKALGDRYEEVQKRVNQILYKKPEEIKKPKAGDKLILENKKLFPNAYAETTKNTVSGTYYLYDGKEINGRYRITNRKDRVNKEPISENVTGFIDI